VTGVVVSEVPIQPQDSTWQIDQGHSVENVELPSFDHLLEENLPIPAPTLSLNVFNGQVAGLVPASYGTVHVYSGGAISLFPGKYYFQSLQLEPGSRVSLSSDDEETLVDVNGTLFLRGDMERADGTPNPPNLTLYYRPSNAIDVDRPFFGTIVAPDAEVRIRADMLGAVFARGIELFEGHGITQVATFGKPAVE
jgi:hypothetical protein